MKVDSQRVFITRDESSLKEEKGNTPERNHKQIFREYHLPAEIEPHKVTADVRSGVLTVTLPKRVQSTSVVITSKAA